MARSALCADRGGRCPVSDFASTAMVRVLAQGMRELGLEPPPCESAPGAGSARVDLDLKQSLVASALHQGGIGCLALLGRGLHRHAHEPTHAALASARDAADLFLRWARLERYVHSCHRCEVQSIAPGRASLRHLTLGGGPPPLAAEDLVVLGVLAALLEALGLQQVTVRLARVPVYPQPDAAALQRAVRRGATAQWNFAWQGEVPRPATPVQLSPLLPDLVGHESWPEVAKAACRLLLADLMRPLPLIELAQAMQTSPRSLQRALGSDGLSYTTLLAQARRRAAAWWLLHTPVAIAEVGFLCGYSDQSHLTRDLHQHVGLTPARYREEFALARPACEGRGT